MKAEHRKELQTNVLAHRMEQFVQGMKGAQKPTSVVLWAIIVLGVATFVLWVVLNRTSAAAHSGEWATLDGKDGNLSVDTLDTLIHEHPGTPAARIARFQQARIKLEQGLAQLCSSAWRKEATASVKEAGDLYRRLANETSDNVVLRRQALLGVARAEEALIGTADPAEAPEQLKRTLDAYDRYLKDAAPDSPVAEQVRKHVQELEKDPGKVTKFYTDLSQKADQDAKRLSDIKPDNAGGGPPPFPAPNP